MRNLMSCAPPPRHRLKDFSLFISSFDDKLNQRRLALNTAKCKPATKRNKNQDISEDDLGELCKALGHPARIRLIRILLDKGECISGDLAEEFSLAQSTVSEHLRILKEAGLVKGTVDGPRRCYCVNEERLNYFKSLVEKV